MASSTASTTLLRDRALPRLVHPSARTRLQTQPTRNSSTTTSPAPPTPPQEPPPARPYKASTFNPSKPRPAAPRPAPASTPAPKEPSRLSVLLGSLNPLRNKASAQDVQKVRPFGLGQEVAYKDFARRYIRVLVGLPFVIYLTWVIAKRGLEKGHERKEGEVGGKAGAGTKDASVRTQGEKELRG